MLTASAHYIWTAAEFECSELIMKLKVLSCSATGTASLSRSERKRKSKSNLISVEMVIKVENRRETKIKGNIFQHFIHRRDVKRLIRVF